MEKINLERSAKVRLLDNHFGEVVIQCKLDEFDTNDYFNNASLGYMVYNNKQCLTDTGDIKYDIGFYEVAENYSETHEFLGYKWKKVAGGGSGGGGLELVTEMPTDIEYAGKTVLYVGPTTTISSKKYYNRHIYLGSIIDGYLVWADLTSISVAELRDVDETAPEDNAMLIYDADTETYIPTPAYPPTTDGTEGEVWTSTGSGQGEWKEQLKPKFMTQATYNALSTADKRKTWAIITG